MATLAIDFDSNDGDFSPLTDWSRTTTNPQEGTHCLQCGDGGSAADTSRTIEMLSAGVITWWQRQGYTGGGTSISLLLDGSVAVTYGYDGTIGWEEKSFAVPSGTTSIGFRANRESDGSTFAVDNISITNVDLGDGGVDADLDATDADDALSASASVLVTGSLSTTDADDTLSAAFNVTPRLASLSTTDAGDAIAATASVLVTGSLAVTDGDDTLASTADNFLPAGFVNVTDADDTLAATASVLVTGSLDITDADDSIASTADSNVTGGRLTATEADDSISATASVLVTASLNTTDLDDTATASVLSSATRQTVFPAGVFLSPDHRVFLGS